VFIDQLPVRVGDKFGLAGGQPIGEFVSVVGTEIGQLGFVGASKVADQGVDGVLRVLFVGADHPRRTALDPADDVLIATAFHPAGGVRNGPALLVERQPGRGHATVADRADH
jgi:hypothetical protein